MNDTQIQRIEGTAELSQNELQAELPSLLDDLEGRGDELVREHPEAFATMVERMQAVDTAAFVEANPETADQFQELLWDGVGTLVEENPEVKTDINDDITVNFSATDCSMDGHLEIDSQDEALRGGAGTLDDPTLQITGPADTLVGLVAGSVDPIQGFMRSQYEMDGPVKKGTRLAPVMNSVSDAIPN